MSDPNPIAEYGAFIDDLSERITVLERIVIDFGVAGNRHHKNGCPLPIKECRTRFETLDGEIEAIDDNLEDLKSRLDDVETISGTYDVTEDGITEKIKTIIASFLFKALNIEIINKEK